MPDKADHRNEIVIIDGSPAIGESLQQMLLRCGYTITLCSSVADALPRIVSQPPDCIICAHLVGDTPGSSVACAIKESLQGNHDIPVILSLDRTQVTVNVNNVECIDGYLFIPFVKHEVLALIHLVMRNRYLYNALMQTRQRFDDLYERSSHLFAIVDKTGSVIDCNNAFCEKTCIPREQCIGRSIYLYFLDSDRQTLDELLASSQRDSALVVKEFPTPIQLVVDKKESLWVTITPINTDARRTITMLMIQDITMRRHMELEQKNARQQLYRAARQASIGLLAAGTAHELNNPLTAIFGFSEALRERLTQHDIDIGEFTQYLEVIHSEAQRCRTIVENLARFARSEATIVASHNLDIIVSSALKLAAATIHKREIIIVNTIPAGLTVHVDANKLEQVIIHIIAGTTKKEHGTRRMVLSAQADPLRSFIVMRITDTGLALSNGHFSQMFDPVFAAQQSESSMAWALTLCNALMEECNGRISLESSTTGGTTIVLEIPGE